LYRKLGFTIEGIKRKEVWRQGRYLDSQIMSMLKSEYVTMGERLRKPPHAEPGRSFDGQSGT
jgi:hypothetical protein